MSDSGYTPTDAYVRDAFISERLRDRGLAVPPMGEFSLHIVEEQASWHRWLAAHDAVIREDQAKKTHLEIADLIEPSSGIGLANGATRADIAEWIRLRSQSFTGTEKNNV